MFQRRENNKPPLKTQHSNQSVAQKTAHVTTLSHTHPSFVAQQMIGNQAIASMHKDNEVLQGQEKKPDGRVASLPEGLRKRVEQLAGVSLNHVQVHYDSSKPAELNAEAYAQGQDIYLAPGSEQHLPHEVWHIVQQAQGRVQPTANMGETAVNTDPNLEQEATKMGNMALREETTDATMSHLNEHNQQANNQASIPTAQLTIKSKNHSKNTDKKTRSQYTKAIENLLDYIVTKVEFARSRALQWQDFENENKDGHLKKWYRKAKKYVENPEDDISFLNADFGYAIESIACKELGDTYGKFKLQYQVTHGHTRPDIVVTHNKNEIAWIDITSILSEGHIFKKTGTGWQNMLFVYEVLYDELNENQLFKNAINPYYRRYGKFVQKENSIVNTETEKTKELWKSGLSDFASKEDLDTVKGGMKRRAELTKDYLYGIAGEPLELAKNKRQALKGAVNYLEGSYTLYGYKGGGMETRSIIEAVRESSKESINNEMKFLNKINNDQISNDLQVHRQYSLVQQFDVLYQKDNTNRATVKTGLALKSALGERRKLLTWRKLLIKEKGTNVRAISKILNAFPTDLDADNLMTWIISAVKLNSLLEEHYDK